MNDEPEFHQLPLRTAVLLRQAKREKEQTEQEAREREECAFYLKVVWPEINGIEPKNEP